MQQHLENQSRRYYSPAMILSNKGLTISNIINNFINLYNNKWKANDKLRELIFSRNVKYNTLQKSIDFVWFIEDVSNLLIRVLL